jgi:putative aminopeptidase FrvX
MVRRTKSRRWHAVDAGVRRARERWLLELTAIPTASGHEAAVIAWIERWVASRRNVALSHDGAGNVTIVRESRASHARPSRGGAPAPIFITAHLDHPAFVVTHVHGVEAVLQFRGGVHDPYFDRARIQIHSRDGTVRYARIQSLDPTSRPFKTVAARLDARGPAVAPGDIGRWRFLGAGTVPRIDNGLVRTYACDDLAGVAAALSAFDVIRRTPGLEHVGLFFTRAEEVGFIGAIAACQRGSVPKEARLICLETSRSFTDSPVGAGPIVRVGDRTSVFEPTLTNTVSALMQEHEQAHPGFRWQRKLMPGGTCEATTFSAYGYRSTCLCLPLGNYHNMVDIDGVAAGRRPARTGPEFVSLDDFHGLVEMLVVCATRLDARHETSIRDRMDRLMREHGSVLQA